MVEIAFMQPRNIVFDRSVSVFYLKKTKAGRDDRAILQCPQIADRKL